MEENNSVFFEDGVISVEVTLEQDTVWLSLDQLQTYLKEIEV
ncbi:MAG: hypothetical protein RR674_07230 [Anaerorhabdus sp.]